MCYSYTMFCRKLQEEGWNNGNLPNDWVFVSICDSKPRKNEPHPLEERWNVMNLDFDDIGGYRAWEAITDFKWTDVEKELYKDIYGMSEEQGKFLFEFLDHFVGKNVMVHCSAGLSRSQGVVRFLLDMYPDVYTDKDTNPMNPCMVPNLYVTALLKVEWRKKYGGFEIFEKK